MTEPTTQLEPILPPPPPAPAHQGPSGPFLILTIGFVLLLGLGSVALYVLISDDHDTPESSTRLAAGSPVPEQLAVRPTGTLQALIANAINDPDSQATLNAAIQAEIDAAVQATFIALTPTPTLPPTQAPVAETFSALNPRRGRDDAPVTLVEFSDYLCPFCARFHAETLDPLLEHYGGLVRFIYREYPIIGGNTTAAIGAAAQCANFQGRYWEFTDLVWQYRLEGGQDFTDELLASYADAVELDMNAYDQCLEDNSGFNLVVEDYNAGRNYQITGTPTFFINGIRFVGAQPIEAFMEIIDAQLREQGIEPPARS